VTRKIDVLTLHASRVTFHEVEGLRLDKWLWFTRFFKSRSQATEAVGGGLVHVNGERAKPARSVRVGDTLSITRGETHFEVVVQKLLKRRGPASEAQAAYEETQASVAQRERRRENHRHVAPAPFHRPDKHARRALRNLRGRSP
jgi:ribosome-associated heat shock protein Hsp15